MPKGKLADKTAALADVAKRVASCEACTELCRAATNSVPGEGHADAEIMLIGEAPGAKEDLQGRPFVGAAGKFLDQMLGAIGLVREDVFITNIVKYRPPENRDPTSAEVRECWPYLVEQIKIIQPKLIVLLGRHAMNTFLPDLKISQAHGQPKRKGGLIYLPLYHPAAALYNGDMRQILIRDFELIPAIMDKIEDNTT